MYCTYMHTYSGNIIYVYMNKVISLKCIHNILHANPDRPKFSMDSMIPKRPPTWSWPASLVQAEAMTMFITVVVVVREKKIRTIVCMYACMCTLI